jgi:hypothetical protein
VMRPFSADELARMQAAQEAAMMDTCDILERERVGQYESGIARTGYVLAATTPCGFDPTASEEVMDGAQVAVTDARLRLPIGAEVGPLSRVRITHRFGVELDDRPTYEAIGRPERGPSGLVLNLRLVTDGSG